MKAEKKPQLQAQRQGRAKREQEWNLIDGFLPYAVRGDLTIFDQHPDAKPALAKLLRKILKNLKS